MSSPNSALAAWQLTVMAVVVVGALAIWLTAVYRADREPRWRSRAAADSAAPGQSAAGTQQTQQPADPGSQATGSGDRIAA